MTNETSNSADTLQAVSRALQRFHSVLSGFIALVGSYFVFSYQSDNAILLGYSWKYILAVIGPYLFLVGLSCFPDRLSVLLGTRSIHRRFTGLIIWLPLILGTVLAIISPEAHTAMLLFILSFGSTAILWARHSGRPQSLLLSLGPILLVTLMFAVEIPELIRGNSMVVWGQANSFLFPAFPTEAPFIGVGGRLKSNLDVRMNAPEYKAGARLITNSIGLRNSRDFALVPDSGITRVLSIGDSFSTGFAAEQDKFFGTYLAEQTGYEVLNAEVSDPAYGLNYLQSHGLDFSPNWVVYGLCSNDVMQTFWYAGPGRRMKLQDGILLANPDYDGDPTSFYEHFQDFAYPKHHRDLEEKIQSPPLAGIINTLAAFDLFSGLFELSLQYKSLPTITKGFAGDYEAIDGRLRLLDGASNMGFYLKPTPSIINEMYDVFFSVLKEMAQSTEASGHRFVLVLFPQRHQVQTADWDIMVDYWNLDPADFDLNASNRIITEFCRVNGIEYVDLLDRFQENAGAKNLYLPGGDIHFNRRGHEVAAQGVADYLTR
ncbi:MAG: hypothetical protein GY893_13035 [bacterium]|nr:hypothetical protein [bacterium]